MVEGQRVLIPSGRRICGWPAIDSPVMTALLTESPRNFCESSTSLRSTWAEISSGENCLPALAELSLTLPLGSWMTS